MSAADTFERHAENLIRAKEGIDRVLAGLAEHRPPITAKDIAPDGCNFTDRSIEHDCVAWMRSRYTPVDASEMLHDPDLWELLSLGERFAVREVDLGYEVIDTDTDETVCECSDEDEAIIEAGDRNREATMEGLCGFPFAQSWGYEISRDDVEKFERAGFVVWLYDGDRYIAGIDGGGYSFAAPHYLPVYLEDHDGSTIPTSTGPRRVEVKS